MTLPFAHPSDAQPSSADNGAFPLTLAGVGAGTIIQKSTRGGAELIIQDESYSRAPL